MGLGCLIDAEGQVRVLGWGLIEWKKESTKLYIVYLLPMVRVRFVPIICWGGNVTTKPPTFPLDVLTLTF